MSSRVLKKLFLKGEKCFEDKKYDKAIMYYDKILEKDPNEPQAWLNKGAALTNQKKYTEAIQCLAISLKLNPKDPIAWFNKGIALEQFDKYEEALESYHKANSLDPTFEHAKHLEEALTKKLGKGPEIEALEKLEKTQGLMIELNNSLIEEKTPSDQPKEIAHIEETSISKTQPQLQVKEEELILNRKIHEESEIEAPKIDLSLINKEEELYFLKLDKEDKIKNPVEEEMLEQEELILTKIEIEKPENLSKIKVVVSEQNEFIQKVPNQGLQIVNQLKEESGFDPETEESESGYNEEFRENDPFFIDNDAPIEIEEDNMRGAHQDNTTTPSGFPAQVYSSYNQGLKHVKEGDYLKAVLDFNQALSIDNGFSWAWYHKGLTLLKLLDYEEAIKCFDEAIQLNPKLIEALAGKGAALGASGDLETALECYEEVLFLNPTNHKVWCNKGLALAKIGRHEEAIMSFDEALALNASLVDAWTGKGVALGILERHEEAIYCFDEALKIKPDFRAARKYKAIEEKNLQKDILLRETTV
ncbi:MAG: tetratricopeptide repeat protein [Candidatus Lokiarchaeota archaeon]|nr:tetratricopeptide repeat protein [Candidatus Lokiarchaeota archaeon]